MMPCSCAASSASAICFAMGNASSRGIGPAPTAAPDRRPRQVPVTRAFMPAAVLQAERWPRCADDSARRGSSLRAGTALARSASAANASGRILMATSRSSRVSRARYTSPIPPAPRAERISNGPSRVPEARATGALRIIRGAESPSGRNQSCVTNCSPYLCTAR